jgi:hypothetical protein
MRVEGYSIFMGVDHFNYRGSAINASLASGSNESFKSDESSKSQAVNDVGYLNKENKDPLIKELSASLLKSIANSTKSRDGFELSTTYVEAQALNFSTSAYVKSGDKEMEFELNVSLSRSFVQQTRININDAKALQDPLILNLEGSFPSLSSKTFSFDIDSDGEEDQISMLERNNGFLALDKNSNGTIDNGNELFGAKSGNGFEELRVYDDDKNGWIDENDKIFDKLRIWNKSEGKDELIALGEVGIGAIFLGDVSTPFEFKTLSNEQLGVMRKSSFFLFENGSSSLISQIDLSVSKTSQRELFTGVNENIKKLQGINLYKTETKEIDDSMEKQLEKLQKILKSLEQKLSTASDDEKPALQAQIGAIYSQMMALISKELK